jgi:hypothetical protein
MAPPIVASHRLRVIEARRECMGNSAFNYRISILDISIIGKLIIDIQYSKRGRH